MIFQHFRSVASANKKKAGAPVKLNPIARPSGADPGHSFVLWNRRVMIKGEDTVLFWKL